jgi:hypothetical protein
MLGTTSAASASLTAFLSQDSRANAVATVGTTSSFATTSPTKICLLYQTPAATLIATTFKLWGHRRRRRNGRHQFGGGRQRVLRRHRQLLPPRRGDHGGTRT